MGSVDKAHPCTMSIQSTSTFQNSPEAATDGLATVGTPQSRGLKGPARETVCGVAQIKEFLPHDVREPPDMMSASEGSWKTERIKGGRVNFRKANAKG